MRGAVGLSLNLQKCSCVRYAGGCAGYTGLCSPHPHPGNSEDTHPQRKTGKV